MVSEHRSWHLAILPPPVAVISFPSTTTDPYTVAAPSSTADPYSYYHLHRQSTPTLSLPPSSATAIFFSCCHYHFLQLLLFGRSESPKRSQHDEGSDRRENQSEKGDQAQESAYPCMRWTSPNGKMETKLGCIHGRYRRHAPRGRHDPVVRLVGAYSWRTYEETIQKWAADPV
ncbi:hypothetical protein BHE74_00015680 [Ensete ventricosum]|nr:hypothetical protein GW17_00016787 [Ensete ventricosum]RWW76242.1 hypothetical protein BHE74_00015680 [Ensete ventricosum]RZR79136.1 hypothetical protein BHM03_00004768 [Ensete ventricosum]